MGKINTEECDEHASHFSHQHPLNLISHHPQIPNLGASCSGCKLKPSGMIYCCTVCTFFLHKNCFEMPQRITHPFHKEHSFTLLPEPAYAGGLFNCDACKETGDGFSYHCKPCGIDLHILCAAAPLSLTTAHHAHNLELAFGSPYHTKNFVCHVCTAPGSDHWLYRCNACGFDAHVKCARTATSRSRSLASPQPQPQPQPQQYYAAAPSQYSHPMMMSASSMGVPVAVGGGMNAQNNMALQAFVQMMQNQNNNAAMVQAILGSGGGGLAIGGGDRGLQQMMQLMGAVNRIGLGGGGIPGLDIFGGGGLDIFGGGGLDILGGGGLDILGGGGGLDFLGGLGSLIG